jgi:toxin-antitoxin system PIN domain toxin
MTDLLDGNVLVALVVIDHVHHDRVASWFADRRARFATCPITQGTLLRLLLRSGAETSSARNALNQVVAHQRHDFWPDEVGYTAVSLRGVIGHRQVTDAYLAQLARVRDGQLVTLDRGLAELHPDVAVVVPS